MSVQALHKAQYRLLHFVDEVLEPGSFILLNDLEAQVSSIGVRSFEYRQVLKLMQEQLPDWGFLQTPQTESVPILSGRFESRICLDGTEWLLPGWQEEAMHQGYFLRIHPLIQWKRQIGGFLGRKQVRKRQWNLARWLYQERGESLKLYFPSWSEASGLDRRLSEDFSSAFEWEDLGYPVEEGTGAFCLPVFAPEVQAVALPLNSERWETAARETRLCLQAYEERDFSCSGAECAVLSREGKREEECTLLPLIWSHLSEALRLPEPESIDLACMEEE